MLESQQLGASAGVIARCGLEAIAFQKRRS
jgi:hypothetical protein